MKTLLKEEVANYLSLHLKNWTLIENSINRDLKFKTFVEAFSFMTAIALEAQKLNHHPDWSNSYNKVSVTLTTHTSNGITQLDFDLANIIDKTYETFK